MEMKIERRINPRPEGRKSIPDKAIIKLVQRRIDAWIRAITYTNKEKKDDTDKQLLY